MFAAMVAIVLCTEPARGAAVAEALPESEFALELESAGARFEEEPEPDPFSEFEAVLFEEEEERGAGLDSIVTALVKVLSATLLEAETFAI